MINKTVDNLGENRPWLLFVMPFFIYLLVGSFEPTADATSSGFQYPLLYCIKILLTLIAMFVVYKGYCAIPWRVSGLAIVIGVVGAAIWIVLAQGKFEMPLLNAIGLGWLTEQGVRPGYNPLKHMAEQPLYAYGFLIIRFTGLALIVPIIEEFFLRGFLMRFVMEQQWWKVPFGSVTASAVIVGTLFPMLTHAGELLAALVWFSLITWLMVRTKNIWDCVVAHGLTNLILGIYVLFSGQWSLM